jgi:O-methyltransferase
VRDLLLRRVPARATVSAGVLLQRIQGVALQRHRRGHAEFGSAGGHTFALAYDEARRRGHRAHLWAFDSFRGLPAPRGTADEHPEWEEGALSTALDEFREQCAKNGISRNDYTAVPGFYEETLTAMSPTDEPTDIALAYIDCDLYTSTKAAQDFLRPRLKHGMIVAFDDYFCWSPSQISGERRALLEVDGEAGQWGWTPYIQFGWSGASFVIEEAAQGADDEAGAHKPLGYKLLTAAAALYVVLPFDVIPDFVPVVGHFDDAIVVALVLRAVKQNWLAAFLRLTGLRRASPEPQAA